MNRIIIILIIGVLIACSTETNNNRIDDIHSTTNIRTDTIISADIEKQITYDHINIDSVPYWYIKYDTITKKDLIVKGLLIDKTFKEPNEIINILNAGQDTKIIFDKISNDTIYIELTDAHFVSEQSGSTGAWWFMAETTFTLTEIENINFVNFEFEEGSHAKPGVYNKEIFTDFKIIT